MEVIRSELVARRSSIDSDLDIRQVTVSVKMIAGTTAPRTVVVTIETEKILSKTEPC